MSENKMYTIKNRSAATCIYKVPELHVRREFAPGQSLKVTEDEIEKLLYQPGGRSLVEQYLQICDEEIIKNYEINAEPEYNMSEKDVVELINNGSLDEFMDALDFAPAGVIDLIKTFAISLPMNDSNKRKALKEKTGFDVEASLRHIEEDREEAGEKAEPEKKTRRVNKSTSSGRRTAPKKYEVVDKKED